MLPSACTKKEGWRERKKPHLCATEHVDFVLSIVLCAIDKAPVPALNVPPASLGEM